MTGRDLSTNPFFERSAANDSLPGMAVRARQRERTVPIPETLTPVPGYPQKLAVFKMAASRYWQVRCWVAGRTYRRSTQTQSLRMAQSFARQFYEQLMAERHRASEDEAQLPLFKSRAGAKARGAAAPAEAAPQVTFGALAAQVLANEQARADRGEYALGSFQVLRNRLDLHILPRWGSLPPSVVTFPVLLEFTHVLSKTFSSTTVSQYLVAVRKVLSHAVSMGVLEKLPEFPKIKIVTTPRGAFTPSEYWTLIRCARRLRGAPYRKARTPFASTTRSARPSSACRRIWPGPWPSCSTASSAPATSRPCSTGMWRWCAPTTPICG